MAALDSVSSSSRGAGAALRSRRRRRAEGAGAAAAAAGGGARRWSPLTGLALAVLVLACGLTAVDAQQQRRRMRGGAPPPAEAKGEEQPVAAAATAQADGGGGGGESPAPRNKTTITIAVPPHKVGRVSVPNAAPGMTLSRIAYGSLHFPEFKDDVEALYQNLLTCLKVGVTTIDLSDVYGWYQDGHGKANDIFARVLQAHPDLRPRLELVAKFGIRLSGGYHIDLSPEWIADSVDRYLKQFGTKYVDVLMIHNPDPNMDVEGIARAFKAVKKAGKARAFGISNFHKQEYEALRDAMAKEGLKLSVHELEASVLHPDRIADGTVDYFSKGENEMAILGWGPLGGDPYGGKNLLFGSEGAREQRIVQALTEKGVQLATALDTAQGKKEVRGLRADEVAVAWLLHHPANIVPIIGTTLVNRIVDQSRPPEMVTMTPQDFQDILAQVHY